MINGRTSVEHFNVVFCVRVCINIVILIKVILNKSILISFIVLKIAVRYEILQ